MRRRTLWPDNPPEILRRFNPADWPAVDDHSAYDLWREARIQFETAHGWPTGFDGLLREGIEERHRYFHGWVHGRPPISQ